MTEQPETIFLLPSVWLANESAAILLNRRSVKVMQGEKKSSFAGWHLPKPPTATTIPRESMAGGKHGLTCQPFKCQPDPASWTADLFKMLARRRLGLLPMLHGKSWKMPANHMERTPS